jgi:RsiW-degrading membrane proteinase PrsW (M82 family)
MIAVGLIEEAAKLVVPVGYAFVALIQSGGNVGAAEETLLIRGLLSPAGHAAWTGLACWGLWRFAIEPSGKRFLGFVGMYALAVALHTAWDDTRHDLNQHHATLVWPHWSGKLLNQLSDWSIAHSANHAAGGAHERQVSSALRCGYALTT